MEAIDVGVRSGDVLAGKYRVDRILGHGGMGVVVAAHHIRLDERVALKFLLPQALSNAEAVARFDREARAAVKIKSEHVARVTDVGRLDNGAPFMVMEYLEGSDLAGWLHDRGPMSAEQASEFVLQACEAIAEAHALGIVHRDLKPANLFCIRRADGLLSIKVLDFGISKLTVSGGERDMTRTSAVLGSPLYMSPEQVLTSKGVDARADLWSIGVILYELVTGRLPFEAEAVTELVVKIATAPPTHILQVRQDLPAGFDRVVMHCLEKERERRFQNVAELANALRSFAPARAQGSADRIARTLQAAGLYQAVFSPGEASRPPPEAPSRNAVAGTDASWGTTAAGLPKNRRTVGAVLAGIVTLVVVAGATLGLVGLRSKTQASARATEATAVTGLATIPAPSLEPSTVASTASASSSSLPNPSVSSAPSATPPSSTPVPGARVNPSSPPPVRPVPPPAATKAAIDCSIPFTIDPRGHRVPKPECM